MTHTEIPVHAGRDYSIDIHDLGSHGEGIGRYEGFTVFVPGALPGERVRASIRLVKKKYAVAELAVIETPSLARIEPPTGYYPEVGIYPLATMDYAAQLHFKRERVASLLRRIGHSEANVLPVLGMAHPWHYRNKIQLPVGYRDGAPALGFYEAGSHRIVDMTECLLQDEGTSALLRAAREIILTHGMIPYDETTGEGTIRHIVGRTGTDGRLQAVIVTAGNTLPQTELWIRELRARLPQLVSLYHNVQSARTNRILGPTMHRLWGEEQLPAQIGDIRFLLSPGSFFQVNPAQTEVLYRTALNYAALTGEETVIDAYCGTGTISLFLARRAARVIGVEIFPAAVADARANAERNNLPQAEFIAGDTAQILPMLAADGVRPDVIVMDPARAGCDERVLTAAVAMNPARIVYVSCNPATLARDIAILENNGYRTRQVQPVDMFPHTMHIEAVALLTRDT